MQIDRAQRATLYDDQGTPYLDFSSGGIFAGALGAKNVELHMALTGVSLTCAYGAAFTNKYAERLKAMLRELTGYSGVALFCTGSEATEAFWRLCRVHTGKFGIWGGLVDPDQLGESEPDPKYDSMHGWTLGALIMAGRMSMPLPGVYEWLGGRFFGLTQEMTGAAIFEPYHAPSAQFHREDPTIQRIRQNITTFPDIHFCCDEVQGGFGRTGRLFAHEWYPDLRPEFLCIGKAFGGGFPVSALLGPKEIMEDPHVVKHAHLHSTHSDHPGMAAVGCKVIEIMERDQLVQRSFHLGRELAHMLVGCPVRYHAGRGLLAGLEFRDETQATAVVEACKRRGLIVVETFRKWVKLGPPYVITAEELETGVNILKEAIQEVLDADSEACGDEGGETGDGDGVVQAPGLPDGGACDGDLGADPPGGQDEGV